MHDVYFAPLSPEPIAPEAKKIHAFSRSKAFFRKLQKCVIVIYHSDSPVPRIHNCEGRSSMAPRAAFSLWTISCSMLRCLGNKKQNVEMCESTRVLEIFWKWIEMVGNGLNIFESVQLREGLLPCTPFFLDDFMYISMPVLERNRNKGSWQVAN